MKDIKRPCSLCGEDQTPFGKGLDIIKNPKGNSIGLVGRCCYQEAKRMVDKLAIQYGAYIVNGNYLASPRGTPNVCSFEELKKAIGE